MSNTFHKNSKGETIFCIGDPHLGRLFLTNVPLEARGVREQQLRATYVACLNEQADYICMMGDLFDKFDVPNSVILFAWRELEAAAIANPKTEYIFNRGNHDESRDTSLKSSWSVFKKLSEKANLPNVTVMGDDPIIVEGWLGVIPWHPFRSPEQRVKRLKDLTTDKLEYVLTHNDTSTYGDDVDPENLMDFEGLAELTDTVLNGHVHVASKFKHEDLQVINTGSMLPLTFAEDKDSLMFRTLTLEEFNEIDKEELEGVAVRILLKPDEEAPEPIKCLQFKVTRVNEKGKEEVGEVKPEDFELKTLFDEALQDLDVDYKDKLWARLKDKL